MCGIAGFFGQRPVSPEACGAILGALARRGPDARHVAGWGREFRPAEAAPCNALLHTRLSIRDTRHIADQPMSNPAGDIWICYNGEVYGWEEDARALQGRGFAFRTTSDTEFILHAYAAWGMGMLPRLRGMFAIAILDLRLMKLFLIRDRMGLKPLVYYHGDGEFAFASTVRGLLPYLPPGRRNLSPEGLDAYLAHRYIPAPRTIFRDIARVPNGHYLELDLATGALSQTEYWQPAPQAGDWRETLDEAVRLRTIADRPVGLFLSGGIDSSLLASRLAGQGHTQISAFTAAFPGSPLDESADAAEVARRLGLPHYCVEVPTRIRDDLPGIVADLDEPFADPSIFPLWYLARETTRHVKVVLGGDGGDELFAGYKRYAQHLRSAWRRGLQFSSPGAGHIYRNPGWWSKLRRELGMRWEEAYSLRFSGMPPDLRQYLQPGLPAVGNTYWRGVPDERDDPRQTLLQIDMANYLPEYILRKGDLATMAHGLELRAPLLDHELYQRVLAMPEDERFTRPPKLALAAACPVCRDLRMFDRKKRGFNPPLHAWLKEDLHERLDGLGERLNRLSNGQIDMAAVDCLVQNYLGKSDALAEQVLQLVILDESLRQLNCT